MIIDKQGTARNYYMILLNLITTIKRDEDKHHERTMGSNMVALINAGTLVNQFAQTFLFFM